MDQGGEADGDATDEQDGGEDETRTVEVAGVSRKEAHQEGGEEGEDVGVGDLGWGEVEGVFDCVGELVIVGGSVSVFVSVSVSERGKKKHTKGGKVYQAQKATKKPIHEKKKTRPWRSIGLKTGMRWAFLVGGLRGGGRKENWKPRTIVFVRMDCRIVRKRARKRQKRCVSNPIVVQ